MEQQRVTRPPPPEKPRWEETDMRQDWEARHPNVPWREAMTEVQDAWEQATKD